MLLDEAIVLGARDALIAAAIPALTVVADHGQPTQEERLPFCDVFVGQDEAAPDGDERTWVTRTRHRISLAVELTARGNSQREAKAWLAAAGEIVLDTLLSSREWAQRDGVPVIEGFAGVRRAYVAPPDGNHLLVKLQIEILVLARTRFAPDAASLPDFATLSLGIDMDTGDDAPVIGATIDVPV